jgi:hypothetical protein
MTNKQNVLVYVQIREIIDNSKTGGY